jgi:hypothetical protein
MSKSSNLCAYLSGVICILPLQGPLQMRNHSKLLQHA